MDRHFVVLYLEVNAVKMYRAFCCTVGLCPFRPKHLVSSFQSRRTCWTGSGVHCDIRRYRSCAIPKNLGPFRQSVWQSCHHPWATRREMKCFQFVPRRKQGSMGVIPGTGNTMSLLNSMCSVQARWELGDFFSLLLLFIVSVYVISSGGGRC